MKLVFPLVLLIFPSLLCCDAGTIRRIVMFEAFQKYFV